MDQPQDRQNGTGGRGNHTSDEELIRLVQTLPHGDARRDRACEDLMARYGHIVRSAVQRHRAAPDLAKDLTQSPSQSPARWPEPAPGGAFAIGAQAGACRSPAGYCCGRGD